MLAGYQWLPSKVGYLTPPGHCRFSSALHEQLSCLSRHAFALGQGSIPQIFSFHNSNKKSTFVVLERSFH